MPSRHLAVRLLSLAAVVALAACADPPSITGPDAARPGLEAAKASASGGVVQRSLEEFLAAQGTLCAPGGGTNADGTPSGCVSLLPWIADMVAFCDDPNEAGLAVCMVLDYAGIANRQLGDRASTRYSGSIRERVLPDGRALLSINLHTRNAVTFAVLVDYAHPETDVTAPPILGHQLPALLADPSLEPTYGDINFRIDLVMPEPGMPLPDLVEIFHAEPGGIEVIHMTVTASAVGPLHAASGYAEGTLGRMWFTYTDRVLHWQGPKEPRFMWHSTPIRIQPIGN